MLLICQSPWAENHIISHTLIIKKIKKKTYGRIKCIASLKRKKSVYNYLMHEREYDDNHYSRYGRAMANLFFPSIR